MKGFAKQGRKLNDRSVNCFGELYCSWATSSFRRWSAPTPQDKCRYTSGTTDQTELCSFLGLASYYRQFIKDFSGIAAPLHHALTVGNKKAFPLTTACDHAFGDLKKLLVNTPVLSYLKFDLEFILNKDTSDMGIRAVLSQIQEGE